MSRTIEEIKQNTRAFERHLADIINAFSQRNGVRVSVDVRETVGARIGEPAEYYYTCSVEVKL